MPRFLASYDLKSDSNPYSEFLKQARDRPWDCWLKASDGAFYRLPNTTLIGTFDTLADAVASLKAARAATQQVLGKPVTMEKYIISEYHGGSISSDEVQKT